MASFLGAVLLGIFAFYAVSAGPLQAKTGQEITFTNLGNNHTYTESQPSLSFNDLFMLCKTGVWVTYSGENYQTETEEGFEVTSIFGYLQYTCHLPYGVVGSARFVGSDRDYFASSVTLFDQASFSGNAQVFEGELAEINSPVESIVTIGTQVELFQDTNFGGESFCLESSSLACTADYVCWLWSWEEEDLPWNVRAARSAKAGCSATAKVYKQSINGFSGSVLNSTKH